MKNSKNKRLYLLAVILFLGFGCVWLMPNSGDIRSSRLSRYLPMEFLGEEGTKVLVTGKELQILAAEECFTRRKIFTFKADCLFKAFSAK